VPSRAPAIGRPGIHRLFVCAIFGLALGAHYPARVDAQEVGRISRVVILGESTSGATLGIVDGFRRTMRDLGWVEGRNLVVEVRYASSAEQWPQISAEVERLSPDAVLACAPCAFRIAPSGPAPIRGIPIVFVAISDPVSAKMVVSLARPGGNMTGVSYLGVELNVKRLQLLKEAIPRIGRVGVLVAKGHPLRDRMVGLMEDGARALNVKLHFVDVASTPALQLEEAFEALAGQGVEAVIALQGAQFNRERKRMADLALRHHLPLVHEFSQAAEAGAFMAYSTSADDLTRLATTYVDKILKGARPADLPVQQPTHFELVINMKTAKALGLTIPPSLLRRADQVLE
jgi:putative ABC transport system substrate-binding protein